MMMYGNPVTGGLPPNIDNYYPPLAAGPIGAEY